MQKQWSGEPMWPGRATVGEGKYYGEGADTEGLTPLLGSLEAARSPLRYMARLVGAGNEEVVADVYRKLIAVRVYKRAEKVGDVTEDEVKEALKVGRLTAEEAEAIFRPPALPTAGELFAVLPPGRPGARAPLGSHTRAFLGPPLHPRPPQGAGPPPARGFCRLQAGNGGFRRSPAERAPAPGGGQGLTAAGGRRRR